MLLREVGYARPATLAEAVELLAANDGARALAGGQTLLNVMKARAGSPDQLVDLSKLEELKGIELAADGTLTLGAMTTYTDVVKSSEARARPILGDVCGQIADVQVRNRGTLGGNVCTNDPTNHLPPLFAALDAKFTIAGAGGERTVSAADFFLGVYLTAVGPGELLTRLSVPAGRADGFAAVTLGVEGTCIVSAAASLNGSVKLALGCVDAVPVVLEPASTDAEAIRAAVAGADFHPPSDVHASAEYRRQMARVMARRAVLAAIESAAAR